MSFFKGEEAIAIVKVPEELFKEVQDMNQKIVNFFQEDQKSARLVVHGKVEKRYKINFFEDSTTTLLFKQNGENDFKVRSRAKYGGACFADDEDDLALDLQGFIDDTKNERVSIKIADSTWEAKARKPIDKGQKKQNKADVWDDDSLKTELFRRFAETEIISFDDLKKETNASKQMLEKVLKEIAEIYQKDGKLYRLKEQYRRTPNKKVKTS